MARPRLPTALLEARGAFKHDPARGRAREGEPKASTPLGNPPDRLDKDEKKAWDEIVKQCHEGVLCAADRSLVEMTAVLLAESWRLKTTFPVAKAGMLMNLLGRLGMTPADRSRVNVSPGAGRQSRFAGLRKPTTNG